MVTRSLPKKTSSNNKMLILGVIFIAAIIAVAVLANQGYFGIVESPSGEFYASTCADSDDANSPTVAGNIKMGSRIISDRCYTTTQTEEWYCYKYGAGYESRTMRKDCTAGLTCSNGACVPPTWEISNSGTVFYTLDGKLVSMGVNTIANKAGGLVDVTINGVSYSSQSAGTTLKTSDGVSVLIYSLEIYDASTGRGRVNFVVGNRGISIMHPGGTVSSESGSGTSGGVGGVINQTVFV